MQNIHASGLPPSLIVPSIDFNRLETLLDSPALRRLPAAAALMEELNRAEVLPPEQVPGDVVTMNSTVDCIDESSGERHRLTLVYPNDANVEKQRVSVLAPVGSALLGLSVGQCIDWQAPGGRHLRLRVTGIEYQPEASGDFHR
ncbi:nucleoside diphosphate kinase regulator [Pseudoxanthomonas sangjuensis]|uniref:nucleoside diphosphate kinase regulator n=1 Tax=Pseudoxanthomonas sangjuensis TaxID=1503750 RepID=UPI001391409C|nr:nucleoside diphosphate kinase regulator [Pseudoxanthomonas sangjuensis]KAF1707262.1 nucleoside diphosphate kinase regulator [Pseudoxanthomonas sangjuensis]